jgi:hypothetical protein
MIVEAMRQDWSDEKLDGLSHRVDDGFRQVDQRLDRIESRFDRMDDRFAAMQRMAMRVVGGGMIATMTVGFLAVIATQLS